MIQFLYYLIFFLSGFSALIYEVIWTRKMVLVFGNTAYAVATVISIYFLGLAVGSFLAEKFLSNFNPQKIIKVYALIELTIGIFALLTLIFFPFLQYLPLPPVISPLTILIIITTSLLIILPTTIMIGSTLPVMIKLFNALKGKQPSETIGRDTGRIYAVNTLGGVLGVFISGFFLIANAGLNQTLIIAASINIAIGWLILIFSRKKGLQSAITPLYKENERKIPSFDVDKYADSKFKHLIYIAFFGSGMAAMSLEVLLTRTLTLIFGSSTYSFSTILITYLLGIVFGSALAAKLLSHKKWRQNAAMLFAWCLFFNSLLILIILPIIQYLPFIFLEYINLNSSFIHESILIFIFCLIILFPVTTLMGATFPLVVASIARTMAEKSTPNIGQIYAVNTFGGIFGSLIAGFTLISLLGVEKSILVTALFYLFSGSFLLVKIIKNKTKKIFLGISAICIFTIGLFIPSWNKKVITMGPYIYYQEIKKQTLSEIRSENAARELLYFKDGLSANVAVLDENNNRFLRIDGKTDASSFNDLSQQLLIGHIPMMLSPHPKDVLVIGLGSGITLGAITTYPAKTIDMVEIEPAVVSAASFFKESNNDALSDPRVNMIINDGRNYLQRTSKKYDVISSEPSNIWISGMSNLFTLEYFELAKKRLREDGIMLHWVQLYKLSDFSLSSVIRTFSAAFPYVSIWTPPDTNDLLLVGSTKPHRFDQKRMEKLFADEKIKNDLSRIAIYSPVSILRNYLFNNQEVKRVAELGMIHRDNRPFLEFMTPLNLHKIKTFENMKLLFQHRSKDFKDIFPEVSNQKESNKEMLIRDLMMSAMIVVENDPDQSIKLTEDALMLTPDLLQLKASLAKKYFHKAESLFAENKIEQAGVYLEKAIILQPNYSQAHSNLAGIYLIKNMLDQAKKELDEAIKISPNRTEPHINLAIYYQYSGDVQSAIHELEKTLRLDPGNKRAKDLYRSLTNK